MGSAASYIHFGQPPEELPSPHSKPTFDPQYGFTEPRKPREVKISEQEMKALKIPKDKRDYCAHIYKDLLLCYKQYTPLTYLCKPELHAYEHCQVEDVTLRMKEYEREKRLRMRKLRKEGVVN